MDNKSRSLAVIGVGNMAKAIIHGIIKANIDISEIFLYDNNDSQYGDLKELNYKFKYKPLLIGGKAMEYYGLRKAGADIDLVIEISDHQALVNKYPSNIKDLYGDIGVCEFGFEIWNQIQRRRHRRHKLPQSTQHGKHGKRNNRSPTCLKVRNTRR